MDAIGVKRPTVDPHATAYVDEMVELIAELVDRGRAYVTSDGVYFSVETVEDYGLLAHQSLADMRAGGGDRALVGEEKRDPADFVLWKLAKPGEPSWPSPWGAGRPGWHTECVVMSLDLLGEGFDLHGGGHDLAFPHHENERAQAVALGRQFASHWMHNGLVEVEGEKMSKSLGNFTNLLDLIETVDPRAYRMLVLQSHYRSPVEVSKDTTDRAERSLAGLDAFARRVAGRALGLPARRIPPRSSASASRMDDDLDTPAAMALLFDSVRQANAALDAGDLATAGPLAGAVDAICEAVGLELQGDVTTCPRPWLLSPRTRRRRAARRTSPAPTRCATSSRPMAGSWRTPRTARSSVAREATAGAQAAPPWVRHDLDHCRARPRRVRHRPADPAALRRALRRQRDDHRHPARVVLGRAAALRACLGRLSDRIGRKPVILISLFGTAAGSFFTGAAGSLPLLFLGRLVDGASGASVSVAQAAVADVAEPSERPRLLGLLGAAFGLGFVAGPALGALAALGGPHVPFFLAACLALGQRRRRHPPPPRDRSHRHRIDIESSPTGRKAPRGCAG